MLFGTTMSYETSIDRLVKANIEKKRERRNLCQTKNGLAAIRFLKISYTCTNKEIIQRTLDMKEDLLLSVTPDYSENILQTLAIHGRRVGFPRNYVNRHFKNLATREFLAPRLATKVRHCSSLSSFSHPEHLFSKIR